MSESEELKIIKEFRDLAETDNFDNLKIIYQVSGGPPGEQFIQRIVLPGREADAEMSMHDQANLKSEEKHLRLESTKKRNLFKLIGKGMVSLLSPEKAIFLPDSLIASLTVQVTDKRSTVYFLADKVDRDIQNKPIPTDIANAIEYIEGLQQ
jgi:hypothetical protein